MGVAIRRLDDLKWHGRPHLFDLECVKFAADQAFNGVQRVCRIRHRLSLCDLADETLVFVCKTDYRRRCTAAFFIGDDLDCAAFQNRDAAVCCAEIDAYYFAHSF